MKTKTLIISRYNENLDWLKDIKDWDYIIYNKGDNLEIESIRLPNVGREAHTYLYYIVENYDNLPEYIGFLQGRPFDHYTGSYPSNIKNGIARINSIQTTGTDFFDSFSVTTLISDKNGKPNHHLPDLTSYAEKYSIVIPDEIHFTPGAQFFLSRDVILRNSRDFYNELLKSVSKDIRPSEAYILERLWRYIFKNEY